MAEIRTRIAMSTAQMTKLNQIWKSKDIHFPTKLKLYKSLIQSIVLYMGVKVGH